MRASSGRADFAVLTLFYFVVALTPSPGSAQCASLEVPTGQYLGDQIHLIPGSDMDGTLIENAISMWDTGCPDQMGSDFPKLLNGGSGGASYTVSLGGHNSQNAHCGVHTGNTITIYTTSVDASGNRQSCGNVTMNLAHEVGHVLGLNDAPQTTQCQYHIMAWINRNNAYSRSVNGEECTKVDSKWRTNEETTGRDGNGQTTPPCV